MKKFLLLFLFSLTGAGLGVGVTYFLLPKSDTRSFLVGVGLSDLEAQLLENKNLSPGELQAYIQAHAYRYDTVSGHYLAGRFAQRHYDWQMASAELQDVLEKTGETDADLLKRAMVLSMGAGQYDQAVRFARQIEDKTGEPSKDRSTLALLFLSIHDFKMQDYKAAAAHIGEMPVGGLSNFIMPLLRSWSQAALGTYDVAPLKKSLSYVDHLYHIVMISDFMDRHDDIEDLLTRMTRIPDLGTGEMEVIADIYAHIGDNDKALTLYETIQATGDNPGIASRIRDLKSDQAPKIFDPVSSPEAGIAKALYDMAHILAQDYNDESARVFAHMALYLNPALTDSKLLLARLAARNESEEDAINVYKSITDDDPALYIKAREQAADLMEDRGRTEDAIALLNTLYKTHQDVETLIQIGDIYRRAEDYKKAVDFYDKAEKTLEGGITAETWHLHYVRGMAYEQMGHWKKAEKDLKAALGYQPENPLVLNYLGYAWADQGQNLDEALTLIQKAVNLRPADGYITDSLGWVLYRMGRFEDAVPHLEQAVELRPYDPVINDHLGDAYWRVGRRLEARFQWVRAKNYTEKDDLRQAIDLKLLDGLPVLSADLSSHTGYTEQENAIRAAQVSE